MPSPLIYAVGDIHGSYYKLARLLKHCNGHSGPRKARFVCVGGYIDRGQHSREVVELLIDLQKTRPGEICCLRGNDEYMLSRALDAGDKGLWLCSGGDMMLRSYGVTSAEAMPEEHLVWVDKLPHFKSDDKRCFVH